MKVKVTPSSVFVRKAKQLAKKYPSFVEDLRTFEKSLVANPKQGVDLGRGLRKIRMSISSKGAGKSGGARVIAHEAIVSVEEEIVTLITIYDKSKQESISDSELKKLLKEIIEKV